MDSKKEVTILGGGLAGLAAAVVLSDQGLQVTLVERKPFLGGRASSYPVPNSHRISFPASAAAPDALPVDPSNEEQMPPAPATLTLIDNCQHVLLRCCTNLLDFYQRLGVDAGIRFFDRYVFLSDQGRLAYLKSSRLPAPFHLLPSFAGFGPLDWKDKLAVAYALFCMLRAQDRLEELDRVTMLSWLRRHRQTARAIENFWRTVLVSALNEDIEVASARYGLKVFLDGLLRHPRAFHMGVPVVPLKKLYTEPCMNFLSARGGKAKLRTSVTRIQVEGSKVVGVLLSDGNRLVTDYYVSGLPPDQLLRLLPEELLAGSEYFRNLRRFQSSPITSICLWFDRQVTDLDYAALLGHQIQWIFRKGLNPGDASQQNGEYLALVVSASRKLLTLGRKEIIDLALNDLHSVLPSSRKAQLLHGVVIKEPHATFSCQAGCDDYRLDQQSPLENLFVAGDWTRTGWPPTMEGAVRSSYRCAELILSAEGRAMDLLQPDLPAMGFSGWLSHLTKFIQFSSDFQQ
jgi:squalene-associated FAD-dependent desaturase